MKTARIVKAVKARYGAVARGEQSGCGCGSPDSVAAAIGYTPEELAQAGEANLGLGCGNPLALAEVKPGMTVLDLGSGAGFDAFLAAARVGKRGRVIGVDMTDAMLRRARANARRLGYRNVEFRKGRIEKLPVEDASVDLVISNCVINLSTNKPAVFREIYRTLKPGGRFAVSDIVLLKALPKKIANDVSAYVGCVAGASLLQDYVRMTVEAGLTGLSIPQIVFGEFYAKTLAGDTGCSCCDTGTARAAATAIASIKLHGHKPGG